MTASDSTTSIVPFNFGSASVRVVMRDGAPWFVAADICAVLELETSAAMRRLDNDECGVVEITHPQSPDKRISVNVVDESGMYELIIGSRKPEAKAFKKWVKREVLPSIRRDGGYIAPTATPEQAKRLAARAQGIGARNGLTSTLQAHGVTGYGYAACTDATYTGLFGQGSQQLRATRQVPAKANLRDNLSLYELTAISLAEQKAERQITDKAVHGNRPCADECHTAAVQVASIL